MMGTTDQQKMALNKALTPCSRPKDTTISLSSGKVVDVWVNKDIFTSNGCLKKQQEFTDVDNTHLLSFQWPAEVTLTTITEWTPEITSRSSERRREFAQSTAKELGCEKWEMVKRVMENCLKNFSAYLLEVSFWSIKLGHEDTRLAQDARDNKESMVYILTHLLADTEYLFSDLMVQWNMSFLPGTPGPVQESSPVVSQELTCQNSITADGPGSLLSCCFSRANSGEQQQEPDLTSIDEKQILMRVLEDVHQIKHSIFRLERKVDENHKGVCERLEESLMFHQRPELLSLPHGQSEDTAQCLMLGPPDQETPPIPHNERHGREQASQIVSMREGEDRSNSDSGSEIRRRVSENTSDRSRPQEENRGREHPSQAHYKNEQESTSDSDSSGESRLRASENSTNRSVRNPSQLRIPRQSEHMPETRHNTNKQESTPNRDGSSENRLHASENSSDRSARNSSQPHIPRQRERASETKHNNKQERASNRDCSSEGRRHASEVSSERSGRDPSQPQTSRQRDDFQSGAVTMNLMAGDDNSDRQERKSNIKASHDDARKMANNHSQGSSKKSRMSSPDPTNRIQSNQSQDASPNKTSVSAAPSNLPSTSRPQPSSSSSSPGPQPSRHQNPQTAGQQSSPTKQFTPQPSASQAAGFAGGGRRTESSQQKASSSEDAFSSASARSAPSTGRRAEGHQKEPFTSQAGMGMPGSDGRHSRSDPQEEMTLLVETQSEARLVKESVQRAYLEDKVKPPKARSFDTMLCLDISESMKQGGAFENMKRTVLKFIEGVEDIVTHCGVEENMGLVTFGGRANVVQNLTNDFNLIRDQIELMEPGGKSPFVEALLVAMAAFVRKGGIVSVSGEWQVKPRIIFISDGLPTESAENDDVDVAYNINNVRLSLSNLLVSFKKGDKFNKVHPVFFIPVGYRADRKYMQAMSRICDGVYMEPDDILRLCHYFRVQETVGKVLVCLRRESEELSPEKIDATLMALSPDLTDTEKQEVIDVVHRELSNPNRVRHRQPKPYHLDNVFEDTEKVDSGKRLPLGTRVIRGPDWNYGDQDGGEPGTVINHHEIHSVHWVKWDNGDYNRYGYSGNRGYDIWKTVDHPRLRKDNEPLDIGMVVKKGKDWKPAEDLTEQGYGQGVIIRKSRPEKKVVVRWSNGVIQTCQWSPTGTQEVDYCPHQEEVDPGSQLPKSRPEPQDHREQVTTTFEGRGMWQWCDENSTWHNYDTETNLLIEAACKKRNPRTCIIERDGKPRRVMFRKMVEKVVDEGNECKVQRLQICD